MNNVRPQSGAVRIRRHRRGLIEMEYVIEDVWGRSARFVSRPGRGDQQNKYLRQRSSELPIIRIICRLV
jgi:hypothetical protein